jgi:hypothetical protein
MRELGGILAWWVDFELDSVGTENYDDGILLVYKIKVVLDGT